MRYLLLNILVIGTLAGCMAVEPEGEVPWDEAIAFLKTGRVTTVFQTHDRWVSFTKEDGRNFSARGPYLDVVISGIGDCSRCKNVGIILE